MSYNVEAHEHMTLVMETFEKWSNSSPNMFFILSDGHKILTKKIIISFFSPMIKDIIESMNQEIGISVNAPSSQILSMLNVLTKGVAVARDKEDLEQISDLIQNLGIDFKNWQIGTRRRLQTIEIARLSENKPKANVTNLLNSNNNAKNKKASKFSNDNAENKEPFKLSNDNAENKKPSKLPSRVGAQEKTGGSKHHLCNDCGRSFQKRSKLNRHQLIHSGIKFVCSVCSFSKNRKDKLSLHIRESHPEMNFDELYKNIATNTNDEFISDHKQEIDEIQTLDTESGNESENTENSSDQHESNDCGKSFHIF